MANKNILIFGKDKNSTAQSIGISGVNNNAVATLSIEEIMLLVKILEELRKFNIQLEIITDNKLTDRDIIGEL